VANTLAYYDTATITAVKSFKVQAPGVDLIKLFGINLLTLFLEARYFHSNVINIAFVHKMA